MRVVVTGSRDFDDRSTVASVLLGLNAGIGDDPDFVVIQGECPFGGADLLAKEVAAAMGWECESFPPANRQAHAFHTRNRAMVDSGADIVVAFINKPLDNSRGTYSTVSYARLKGVKTMVVEVW